MDSEYSPSILLINLWNRYGFTLATVPKYVYIGNNRKTNQSVLCLDVSQRTYDQIFLAYSVSKYLQGRGIATVLAAESVFLKPWLFGALTQTPEITQLLDKEYEEKRNQQTFYIGTDGGAIGNGSATCVASWATIVRTVLGDTVPTNTIPTNTVPTNTIPTNTAPTNTVPTNTIPTNTIPTNTIPTNTVPTNTIPTNTIPTNTIPDTVLSGIITKDATNNIGELTAIYNAAAYILKHATINDHCTIISDSMYSINSIETWYRDWVRKGVLAEKKNTDIIGRIVDMIESARKQKIIVTFAHQKSHKTSDGSLLWELNDLADKECTRLLTQYRNKRTHQHHG